MTEITVRVPTITAGHAALLCLMDRYLAASMDISISLQEVHKLLYLLQVAGEPLHLHYVKAPSGPYAENLHHVPYDIERNLISGPADEGDTPDKELALVPGAVRTAEAFLEAHPDTHERFDRVARLAAGFETPFGLELLTTVHWVITQEQARDRESILRATYEWGARKRQFTPAQIELAAKRLRAEGWIGSAGAGT